MAVTATPSTQLLITPFITSFFSRRRGHTRYIGDWSSDVCSSDLVWALDRRFQPLLEIPVSEITTACTEQSEESWRLRMTWASHPAEFSYRGIFAEHLARVAETDRKSVV